MTNKDDRVVAGVGPVSELLGSGPSRIVELWVAAGRVERSAKGRGRRDPVAELADKARRAGIRVRSRTRPELDEVVPHGQAHQGIVAFTLEFEYADLDQVLSELHERGENAVLLALDGVTDPHNLGAIVRSAYLLGAHAVILPKDRSAKVNATSSKASAGATELLPIAQVTNLSRTLTELKDSGLWIAAVAAGEGSIELSDLDAAVPLCIVLGSEGKGIRPQVRKQCDFQVEIPMMRSGVGSFNVSVAGALVLFEVARQRALDA